MGALERAALLCLSNAPDPIPALPPAEVALLFVVRVTSLNFPQFCALAAGDILVPRPLFCAGMVVAVGKCPGRGEHSVQQLLADALQRINCSFKKRLNTSCLLVTSRL